LNARALALSVLVLSGAIAAFVVALLHQPAQRSMRLAGGPVATVRGLSSRDPQFGDPVVATIEVFVDRGRVDPDTVQLRASFTPFTVTSSTRSVRRTGDISIVRISDQLECLVAACVPKGDSATLRLPPARVTYPGGTVRAAWPTLRVHARVPAAAILRPMLRVGRPQADASYRVRPGVLGWLLLGVGTAGALGGLGLLVRAALPSLPLARRRGSTEVDRILHELMNGLRGDPDGSRLALEQLARELQQLDEPLSFESRVLAWAPQDPQPEAIADLAQRVRIVGGR
jgi:hypothetical protein